MAESSDMKNLNNYAQFTNIVKTDAAWNSSNPLLAIAAMEAQQADCVAAFENISVVLTPQKIKINARQAAFDKFASIVRRSRSVLKSSGATKAEIDDAETWARKILGTRKKPKETDNPDTPANEANASNSAAQLSFDSMSGNMKGYRDMLSNIVKYDPNEADLTIAAITAAIDEADAATAAVSAGHAPVINARQTRDAKLYQNADSAYEVFRMAKEYYKGLHGASSPQYKSVAGLTFKKPFRK